MKHLKKTMSAGAEEKVALCASDALMKLLHAHTDFSFHHVLFIVLGVDGKHSRCRLSVQVLRNALSKFTRAKGTHIEENVLHARSNLVPLCKESNFCNFAPTLLTHFTLHMHIQNRAKVTIFEKNHFSTHPFFLCQYTQRIMMWTLEKD